jgi:primary-amine oxidase
MRLHDVKYKGERFLYSIGLEEAIAHYAGNDPVQSGTAYLGISPFRSQVKGLD